MNLIIKRPEYINEFRIIVLTIPFIGIVHFTQNILKWTFSRKRFIIVTLGANLLVVLSTLIYVVVLELGIKGAFYAHLIGMLFFALLGLVFCRNYFIVPRDVKYILPMLKFGWPYMLIDFIPNALPLISRYIIVDYLSLASLGIYVISFKIASLLSI